MKIEFTGTMDTGESGEDGVINLAWRLMGPISDGGLSAPVAAFSANVTSGFAPLTVTFTDASTNTPTAWEWDFGDGSPVSNDQNPVHIYATPGTYTVSLTATNAAGDDTETKVGYITALWTPAFATTGGGVLPHTDMIPGVANYQDSAKTTPATADGNPVGAVTNQGSNGYDIVQATAGARLTLKLNILNGQPVWRLDGGDWLQGAFAGGALSQPLTIFIVTQLAASEVNDNINNTLVDGDDTTNRVALYKDAATTPDGWALFAGSVLSSAGAANANWNIWTAVFNGASSQFWINGISQGAGAVGTKAIDGLTLGAAFNGSLPWVGDVARFLIYVGNLSDADKDQLGQYFNARFGIAYTNLA